MSIHKTIEYCFVFIAIAMTGFGGVIGITVTSGDKIIGLIFGVLSVLGGIGLLFNFKNYGIADKKIKEMEK